MGQRGTTWAEAYGRESTEVLSVTGSVQRTNLDKSQFIARERTYRRYRTPDNYLFPAPTTVLGLYESSLRQGDQPGPVLLLTTNGGSIDYHE